ncbi:hypothetical protein SO802_015692 [Lithocarpus litseifolius]|uniref:DUF7746 domain-containing protein n=1 Tax=Lithocarpus litseifolius TaxID=425828 RepID=A0AAW2CZQ3_9ROSI
MAENRNKGKAPIQDFPQNKRLTEQPFVRHEGESSVRNHRDSISLQEFAQVAYSSKMHEGASSDQEAISLRESVTVAHSSGNRVVDVLQYTLQENLVKETYGVHSNFLYSTKTILELLHSAYILHNTDLFQRTLKTLENHLRNLEAKNDHITSLLSSKEEIRSKDKTVLMGTCFARLSLKTQALVRSAFANLPSEIQVRILGSKAMTESLDLWFRHFRILVTTRHPDPDDSDHVNDALSMSRWEAYFGNSLRVYERTKHPFPGLLVNFSDLPEDEEEDHQMNPHWLSQMFKYGFVKFIRLTSYNRVSQFPAIIKDTITKTKSPFVSIRCWSTLPEWEMDEWATVLPSKHLVLIGGYSHQGPWFEGNTFLSYRNPKALAICWRNFFSNEIIRVTKELWRNYHFIGNTGRISIFSTRPYYESTPQLLWVHNCDPRRFIIPEIDPIFEPLIYCGLCEQFTAFHEHLCNDDPPWASPEDDGDDYGVNWCRMLMRCIATMMSRLFRSNSTSSLASRSTLFPEIPQETGIINSEEYELSDVDLKLGEWNLPTVPTKEFYKSSWNLKMTFKIDFHIKTIEQVYGINKEYETCYLFNPATIKAYKKKGHNFLHIGLVQIPRTLKWSEVSFPDSWKLENENYPPQIQNPDQDSDLDFVQQLADGSVRLSFDKSRFRFPSGEEKLVKKVIEQNNYTNQCLNVIGKQLERVEDKIENKVILQPRNPSKPIIEKPLVKLPTSRQSSIKSKDVTTLEIVTQKLEELQKLVKKELVTPSLSKGLQLTTLDVRTASSGSSRTSSNNEKEIEHRKPVPPTRPDLQYEERNVSNQFSVSSSKLYEWNIDGLSEQEILNKIQHIAMVANNYLNEGKSHSKVIDLMVLGFTGKLLQWWNNCLTEESKDSIRNAVQKDEEGLPIFEEHPGRGIPDGVNTLIYTIINHFIGKPSNITSRIYD